MLAALPSTVETAQNKRCFISSAARSAALAKGKASVQQRLPKSGFPLLGLLTCPHHFNSVSEGDLGVLLLASSACSVEGCRQKPCSF